MFSSRGFISYRFVFKSSIILLFIYLGCVGSSLLYMGFLQLQRLGATIRHGAGAFCCHGFSYCRARALGMWASVVVCRLSSCGSQALESRLSSCGAWAQLLCSMWYLPGPGLEPMSLALAGRFLTTAPPEKSLQSFQS